MAAWCWSFISYMISAKGIWRQDGKSSEGSCKPLIPLHKLGFLQYCTDYHTRLIAIIAWTDDYSGWSDSSCF